MVDNKKRAIEVIVLFGLVSLFGDMVYEGARSVNGPYLKTLGANAALVGLIGGMGEFVGYGIRLLSGYVADRTRAYWAFTIIGYALLVSVPLMALSGTWQVAAVFIIFERLGKALRAPARDTIISQAAREVGTGWGFGLNEAMDQIGAIVGPLLFAGLFWLHGHRALSTADYQQGYAWLSAPFILLMACVVFAFTRMQGPDLSESKARPSDKLTRSFWLYTLFSFMTVLGLVSFILMGYHFKSRAILSDAQIPLFYAIAMAVDGISALIIGKLYDTTKARTGNEHGGVRLLFFLPLLSALIPVFAFAHSWSGALVAVILWGIVMGAHESVMKSAIADLTPLAKRGTGYGIFNGSYGVAMFIGAALMGLLYEVSIPFMVLAASMIQFLSLAVFFAMKKESGRTAPA